MPRPDPRLRAVRAALRAVSIVSPRIAARWAGRLFCRPPRQEARPREEAFLETGRPAAIPFDGGVLATWEWGAGPLVVLAHGWGSRAGRWSTLARALLAAGYRVVAYDAPAHGRSSGRMASMPEFARALRAVVGHYGPVHGLVGHSLGGAAVALALADDLRATRAVLIAAPADVTVFANRFAEVLRISPRVRAAMQHNLEARLEVLWKDLHLPTIIRRISTPALVIQDRDDSDVTVADAEAIAAAWPAAELFLTDGLGHRTIVRDAAVVARTVEFLA